ncbi:MAG: hypothetical protein N3A65_03705, partial [candidate division WOR-3 bacterium]|nr:hypothetical protein [candidate division WOR-3 bacterium]
LIHTGSSDFLENIEIEEVDYLIARKKIIKYRKEYIPLPGDFCLKKISVGDFFITIEKESTIYWRQHKFLLPDEGYESKIKNIILGDRGVYQFESSTESIIDGFLTDIKAKFGSFVAYF